MHANRRGTCRHAWFWMIVSSLLAIPQLALAAGPQPVDWMLRLTLNGRHIEGAPIVWSDSEVLLLARDGRLWTFFPSQARDFAKSSPKFAPYTAAQMRSELLAELGSGFEVTGTGHYLIAHPKGQGELWSQRFEDLYRSFVHYFRVRGLPIQEPEFPLVAIVWPTQEQFAAYAARDGGRVNNNVLGYYSPTSNRITLYDVTAGNPKSADWQLNAETIIHEATHQTAFNTGLHSRLAPQPRWLVEGLGTMFEAPGVWDSRRYPNQSDRINPGRLADFKQYIAKQRKPGFLTELIQSDAPFEADTINAYAQAWALTFFLSEQHPRQYGDYLKLVAARPALADYPAAERLKDFQKIFGNQMPHLEARFLKFMDGVR